MTLSDGLLDLAARVEGGEGADRELDAAIAERCGEGPGEGWTLLKHSPGIHNMDAGYWERGCVLRAPKPYTSSLDAVTALLERVLPGMSWEVRRSGFGTPSQAIIWNPMKAPPTSTLCRVDASSPARALLAAVLRALSTSPNPKGSDHG